MIKLNKGLIACIIATVAAGTAIIFIPNDCYKERLDDVMITVGDKKITLKEIDDLNLNNALLKDEFGEDIECELNKMIKEAEGKDKEELQKEKNKFIEERKNISKNLVERKILSQKAVEKDGLPKEQIDEIEKIIKDRTITKEEEEESFKEQLLANAMKEKIYNDIKITEEEKLDYYNKNIDKYSIKAGYTVKELFFPATSENKYEVRALAYKDFDDMHYGKTTYETVWNEAKEGKHPLSATGGIVARDNVKVPFQNSGKSKLYMEHLQNLHPGQYASPFEADGGFYMLKVIKYVDKDETIEFENEKMFIENTLKKEKIKSVIDDKLKTYGKELKVEYKENMLEF